LECSSETRRGLEWPTVAPEVNVMHVACDSNVCDKPNTIIVA
jgi:hypothetical protein